MEGARGEAGAQDEIAHLVPREAPVADHVALDPASVLLGDEGHALDHLQLGIGLGFLEDEVGARRPEARLLEEPAPPFPARAGNRVVGEVEDEGAAGREAPKDLAQHGRPVGGREGAEIAVDHHREVVAGAELVGDVVRDRVLDIEPGGPGRLAGVGDAALGEVHARDAVAAPRELTGVEPGPAAQVEDARGAADDGRLEPGDRRLDRRGAAGGGG